MSQETNTIVASQLLEQLKFLSLTLKEMTTILNISKMDTAETQRVPGLLKNVRQKCSTGPYLFWKGQGSLDDLV